MPAADRGSVWLADLGMAAKVRLIRKLGDLGPDDMALVETVVRRWLGL